MLLATYQSSAVGLFGTVDTGLAFCFVITNSGMYGELLELLEKSGSACTLLVCEKQQLDFFDQSALKSLS